MEMSNNSVGLGFMAAFAVSGTVVFIARQFHKRLVSDFMSKIKCELCGDHGSKRCDEKKRVRFTDGLGEEACEDHRRIGEVIVWNPEAKLMERMPVNRQILYKGIMEYKHLKGYKIST